MALGALAALMGVWFAAMASPGPDVVQIIRLGARSTRAAVWAAIGSTTGLVVWTVASLAGLTALISAHPVILVALQVAGGGYLLWMAFSAISGGIKERRAPATVVGTEKSAPQPRGFTPDGIIKLGTAYRMGLVSDLSNPKVVIFFGAIFANFIDPGMGFGANALVGSVLIVESLMIFVGVALCTRAVSKWMSKNSASVDIFSGVVFALLGVIILAEGIRGVLAL
ncbi:LysE family translocator [Corynebacterium minutissimum]|uniref:LysE family translocator n=1 Tax=Corynebacterium minutissimum TaxID=38301 RepID=A0A2X4RQB8_9CORY|nr:LysE family translocator [Corynebacterium minutissimum]KHO30503.1 threonine transporter [Corynebacterium minutissimum]MCG7228505.1 LysE family translocator [Corynebacterium minutissimum]MCG7237622.1 LysE family translocator [Corynebacterium minutissimum]QPS60062.1 LysE family translocator [Corynebacterium minutissimum]QQA79148.1 LysE family translocator [Corynebacterium minutissimum]